MKSTLLILLLLSTSSLLAQTACEKNASSSALKVASEKTKGWVVTGVECSLDKNKKTNVCGVFGNREDGSEIKNYIVTLSTDCKKVTQTRLMGGK